MKKNNIHTTLLILVGGYLLYTAYHLFDNMQSGSADMSHGMFVLLIVFFAICGLAVLFYAFLTWRTSKNNTHQENNSRSSDDQLT